MYSISTQVRNEPGQNKWSVIMLMEPYNIDKSENSERWNVPLLRKKHSENILSEDPESSTSDLLMEIVLMLLLLICN